MNEGHFKVLVYSPQFNFSNITKINFPWKISQPNGHHVPIDNHYNDLMPCLAAISYFLIFWFLCCRFHLSHKPHILQKIKSNWSLWSNLFCLLRNRVDHSARFCWPITGAFLSFRSVKTEQKAFSPTCQPLPHVPLRSSRHHQTKPKKIKASKSLSSSDTPHVPHSLLTCHPLC